MNEEPQKRKCKCPLVTVCDACDHEQCWNGKFMCENATSAGTKELKRCLTGDRYPCPPQPQKQLSECKYKIGDRVEYSYSQPALSCFMHGKVKGNGIIVRLAKPSEHGRGKSAKVFVMDNGALVHENEIIPPEKPKPYQLNKCRCKKGTYLNWFCPKHSPARMSVFEQQNLESPKPSQPEEKWIGIEIPRSRQDCKERNCKTSMSLGSPDFCPKHNDMNKSSQLTEEDRELLKNWPEKLIFKLGGTEGLPEGWKPQGFSSVSVLICDLLAAKGREAGEREWVKNEKKWCDIVKVAVEDERERCLKILFENWASENAPNNYSQIKLAILNPPKD